MAENPNSKLRSIAFYIHVLREAESDRVRLFGELLQADLEQLFDHLNEGGAGPSWAFGAEALRAEPLNSDPYDRLRREQEVLHRRIAQAKVSQDCLAGRWDGRDLLDEVEGLRGDSALS